MSRHLFTVEDTFTIRGRGTILVPGIVPEGDERFRIGDALCLRRPDGSEVEATIDGIECFNPPHGTYPIVVRSPKSDIPLGTEVWST
jgi:translation elongation factor EF-Tu-like GTPase